MNKPEKGFTLIELLIVISVLSILAAVVFPVFSKVREKGRQSVCTSNLRQIGSSVALYLSDYDGTYPYAVDAWDKTHPDDFPIPKEEILNMPTFVEVLQPYIKSHDVFHCPSDFGVEQTNLLPSAYSRLGSSYDFVRTFLKQTDSCWKESSNLAYAFDLSGEWHTWKSGNYFAFKRNHLFLDGHVKFQHNFEVKLAPRTCQ